VVVDAGQLDILKSVTQFSCFYHTLQWAKQVDLENCHALLSTKTALSLK